MIVVLVSQLFFQQAFRWQPVSAWLAPRAASVLQVLSPPVFLPVSEEKLSVFLVP